MREFRECWEDRENPRAFPRFVSKTKPFWFGLAKALASRWQGPRAVEASDLEQEILLGAWTAFRTYDPSRLGREEREDDLFRYVSFVAAREAKRWLHAQRGLPRRNGSDREAAVHDLPYGDLFGEDFEGKLPSGEGTDPESLLVERQEREAAVARRDAAYWGLFCSLVAGDVDPVLNGLRKMADDLVKDAGVRQLLRTDRAEEVSGLLLETLEKIREEEAGQ